MNGLERAVTNTIARGFLAGDWHPPAMASRAGRLLADRRRKWLTSLAEVAVHAFPVPPHESPREFRAVIAASGIVRQQLRDDTEAGREPPTRLLISSPTRMATSPWPVVELHTVSDLADLFGLPASSLQWFADTKSWERIVADEPLRHYRYRWIASSSGQRLIEAPKGTLRHLQRVVLRTILNEIPVHPAAHGFRREHSIHDFVAPHVGAATLVKADLQSFFPSVRARRVYGLWRTAGYAEPVAHALTGLTTNAVPGAILRMNPSLNRTQAALLRWPHLPQGAATSPAIANLIAFRLDIRLTALAASFGVQYTRYADDLAFSGSSELHRHSGSLLRLVREIVVDEGFQLNPLKTAVMGKGERHRLGGVVINERPNVDRRDFDRLKAELHDAVSNGPTMANRRSVQNYRQHLAGRIGWVGELNDTRADRLRNLFDQIDW